MGAFFTRGTTPDFRFTVNLDLTGWDTYVSFGQHHRELARVEDPQIEPVPGGCVISGRLSQEQTLLFKAGDGTAQVRAYKDGIAAASNPKYRFKIYDVIMDGTIPKEA